MRSKINKNKPFHKNILPSNGITEFSHQSESKTDQLTTDNFPLNTLATTIIKLLIVGRPLSLTHSIHSFVIGRHNSYSHPSYSHFQWATQWHWNTNGNWPAPWSNPCVADYPNSCAYNKSPPWHSACRHQACKWLHWPVPSICPPLARGYPEMCSPCASCTSRTRSSALFCAQPQHNSREPRTSLVDTCAVAALDYHSWCFAWKCVSRNIICKGRLRHERRTIERKERGKSP